MERSDCLPFDDFSLFFSALRFCAQRHCHQTRKDAERTPYFNHPVEVAELIWRVGGVHDLTILSAALLHDIIEDTVTEPAEIRELFGDEVLSLVLEVSDDKTLPKDKRKELQVIHAPGLSHGAKLIKLADKICNARDVIFSPPSGWQIERRREYLDWAERVVRGMGKVNARLEEQFYIFLAEGKEKLK